MEFTQQDRFLSIETPLGPNVLLIDRFVASEGISRPFRIEVDLLADAARGMDRSVRPDELLGKEMTITVHREDGDRYFNGFVRRFSTIAHDKRFVRYRAELVPWLSLLALSSDCRPFYRLWIPEIILEVCRQHGFEGDRFIQLTFPEHPRVPDTDPTYYQHYRQYCVQYRETDFNLISRLMEEEGIGYYFHHSRDQHPIVLAESLDGYKWCPGQRPAPLDWQAEKGERETVTRWASGKELLSTQWDIKDFHFDMPSLDMGAGAGGGGPETGHRLYLYDYPGGYAQAFWERAPAAEGAVLRQGGRSVLLRMEEEEAHQLIYWGTSTCPAFSAGHKIRLIQDVERERTAAYLLTTVQHVALQTPAYISGQDPKRSYDNSFTCIPAETLFRPPRRTYKPVIQGAQTARVVDYSHPTPAEEPAEEIWPETYVRVLIRFPWDRTHQAFNGCWARVLQAWAGKTWGHQWLPRVGDEVIVEFMEGDPDCPVVIGSVYNGVNNPPFDLPEQKTQSGIRTRSVPDGSRQTFNMLRFEDKKDHEQVLLRSQNRMDLYARGSMYDTCGGDRHTRVGSGDSGNYLLRVGGNQCTHVRGNRLEQVDHDLQLTVGGGVQYDFQGNNWIHVKDWAQWNAKHVVVEASETISLKVGDSFVVLDSSGVTIHGKQVWINSGGSGMAAGDLSIQKPQEPAAADTGEAGAPHRAAPEPAAPGDVELLLPGPAGHVDRATVADELGNVWDVEPDGRMRRAVEALHAPEPPAPPQHPGPEAEEQAEPEEEHE